MRFGNFRTFSPRTYLDTPPTSHSNLVVSLSMFSTLHTLLTAVDIPREAVRSHGSVLLKCFNFYWANKFEFWIFIHKYRIKAGRNDPQLIGQHLKALRAIRGVYYVGLHRRPKMGQCHFASQWMNLRCRTTSGSYRQLPLLLICFF